MSPPVLSVVITVASGPATLRRCLETLRPQMRDLPVEIVVPYDAWCMDIGSLAADFPGVRFHFVEDLGIAATATIASHTHRLFDRRRAVGLGVTRGRLVAMTDDQSVPAADWCSQIIAAHAAPDAAIGGAIENGVDRPLNWALYYCDFGRYGRPRRRAAARYISDINISYKRAALERVRAAWDHAYHETTVHWALLACGESLAFDPRIVLYQHRPPLTLGRAYRERIEFARVFAETRAVACPLWQRLLYAIGTPLLPVVLSARALRHMLRQRRSTRQILQTLPLVFLLLTGAAIGEWLGYVLGPPRRAGSAPDVGDTQSGPAAVHG